MSQNPLSNVLSDGLSAVGNNELGTIGFRCAIGEGPSLVPAPLSVFLPDVGDIGGSIGVVCLICPDALS
jgi:hypothetical protein